MILQDDSPTDGELQEEEEIEVDGEAAQYFSLTISTAWKYIYLTHSYKAKTEEKHIWSKFSSPHWLLSTENIGGCGTYLCENEKSSFFFR